MVSSVEMEDYEVAMDAQPLHHVKSNVNTLHRSSMAGICRVSNPQHKGSVGECTRRYTQMEGLTRAKSILLVENTCSVSQR